MGKGTPISQELRENIADDLALGYSYGDIADRYGVSFSTIRRVKKSSEAPMAMENTSEEEIGVRRCTNNIIPDTEENVKPHYSPYEYAVDEAVLERMEKLHDRIAEMQLDISNYENELNVLEEFHLKYMEVQNNGT